MGIADLSVKRPVMMTVIVLVFTFFGWIALRSLSMNLMPDVKIPYVTVQTIYPGAGPKEIEMLVTKKIEDAVSTIEGIDNIDSYSLDGVSIMIVQFELGKDVDVANQEVKDKIDQIINNLPTDAKKPIVTKVDLRATPVADIVLSGDANPRDLYDFADKVVKDRLSQIKGVANVTISGGQEREIQIKLNPIDVYNNMISLPALMGTVSAQNIDIPGGSFEIGSREYSVRLKGQYDSISTILNTDIQTPFGLHKLSDFAQVADTGKKISVKSSFYDVKNKIRYGNAVRLGLIKSPDGNVVDVVNKTKEILPEILAKLPPGMELKVVRESASFVESSVNDTLSNIYLGIIITAIVLFFFLHDIKSTLIAAIMMPTSVISSFLLLQLWGLDLNIMTLLGISVTIGVLVANSIVILENIFRYKDLGYSTYDATIKGTNEVVVAVLASTLTNLVVFIPLANLSSIVGQFLKALALSATFTTIFSLIYSFILTPMLASKFISDKKKEKGAFKKFMEDKIDNYFIKFYEKALTIVLKNKKMALATFAASIILFIIVIMGFGSKLGFEFQPTFDQGIAIATIELPTGTNLETTSKKIKEIEDIIKKHPEVVNIVTDLGKSSQVDLGSNLAVMTIYTVDRKERNKSIDQLTSEFTKELAVVPNVKINVLAGQTNQAGSPIEFYILGQNEYEIQKIADKIYSDFKTIPGLINFEQSTRIGKPELTIYPDRTKLAQVGLNVNELAFSLRSAIEGMATSKYKYNNEEYDLTIKMTAESVDSPEKISSLPIVTKAGVFKLSDLAEIKFTPGPTKILHRDKFKTVKFTGAPAPGVPLGNITSEIEKRIAQIKMPTGYSFAWGGSSKIFKQMMMDLMFAFFVGIFLTYLLLAAMLESFIQPLYILITVPLGLIGVILSAYFTHTALGITALMGIILLTGIVVNNAILVLDLANQLIREEGKHIKESLIYASVVKLKPIIMSNAALALAMLPLALGIGDAGVELRQPLGIVTIGGIVASTILTIFVVPALYYIFAREKKHNNPQTSQTIA
ncbi:MAG: efflux RND transporter permease subunit [Candidatus Kapaibacteriota bacterium]